jgi:hypothetical protein
MSAQILDEALALLVCLGADVNARTDDGTSLIFSYAKKHDASFLLRLLGHGAVVDVRDKRGYAPLMVACHCSSPTVPELLRRSSLETCQAVLPGGEGSSALDMLTRSRHKAGRPWLVAAVVELLRSGVPFNRNSADILMPFVTSWMRQLQLDLALLNHHNILWDWRGHEAMVDLAFDMQDVREAEQGNRAARGRGAAAGGGAEAVGGGGGAARAAR